MALVTLGDGWVGVATGSTPEERAAVIAHNEAVTAQWVIDHHLTDAPIGPAPTQAHWARPAGDQLVPTSGGGAPPANTVATTTPVPSPVAPAAPGASRVPVPAAVVTTSSAAPAATAQQKRLLLWAGIGGVGVLALVLLLRR